MKKIRILGLFILVCTLPLLSAAVLAETGSTTVQGSVPVSMTVSVPSTVQMPSLVPGMNVQSAAQTVTVTTNSTNWSLSVAESGGGSDGKMGNSNNATLMYAIQVKGGDLTGFQSLGPSALTLKSGASGSATINDIYFSQPVDGNEKVGTYYMTLVFTATATQ